MVVAKSTSVIFESGMLLSKEMLEQLESQTHLLEMQYHSYPDGIIYGLEISENDGKLFFSPGLVKLGGKYYYISESIDIWRMLDTIDANWKENTVDSALVLAPCEPENIHQGVISECLDFKLVSQNEISSDVVCLAEFQYYTGKRDWNGNDQKADEALRNQLHTNGTAFSFLNVRYSLPNESVFSPYVYGIMRSCLEQIIPPSAEDVSLIFMLSQNHIVSFEVLKQWFRCKKMEVDFKNRKQIIEKFLERVKNQNSTDIPQSSFPLPSALTKETQSSGFGM